MILALVSMTILWLILGTAAYIKETGDFAILDEQVPYDCNPDDTGSLLEHLQASFSHVVENKGPHGLPLIGRADWNDCLNLNCHSTTPDESFQTTGTADGRIAESVLIAGMFVAIGLELVELLERKGKHEEASEARHEIELMREAISSMDMMGSGSYVHMMHLATRWAVPSVKRERYLLRHKVSV